MRKLAVFDIDGTIFRSSLTIELLDALIEEGVFPVRAQQVYARAYQQWLDRKDTYERYVDATIQAFNQYIQGVKFDDLIRVAKKVAAFHRNRVYRYTRDLLKELKQKRHYLVAISHSSRPIVKEFCRNLGFDKIYGRYHEVDERGRLTGRDLWSEMLDTKSGLIEWLVAHKGFPLKGSVGVGDTESDIPFLEMVERPICFNPNLKLYRHARRRGWVVVVERKDVIYKLLSGKTG